MSLLAKFYFSSGSTALQPIASAIGMEIDKINFMACQIFAIAFGRFFFYYLDIKRTSATIRHLVELFVGVALTLFCFGIQIVHILAQSTIVYLIISFIPLKNGRMAAFLFSVIYLSMAHLFRMYYDYQGYSLDITGPLMILTQKLSSLAYNLYDGEQINNNIPLRSSRHRKHALRRKPNLLEYWSYCFSFHSIMVGPFTFMADYLRFIEGREQEHMLAEFSEAQDAPIKPDPQEEANKEEESIKNFEANREDILAAWYPLLRVHLSAVIFLGLLLAAAPFFPFSFFLSEDYYKQNFIMRLFWMNCLCFFARIKYYTAWEFGRAANLSAGFGFSGFNSKGKPSYKLVKNFHFWNIELGTSIKMLLDNWNVGTTLWLREVVYDRTPRQYGTLAVFMCSAIWHGFYPGYYLCFMTAAVLVSVGRICRRHLRPWWVSTVPGQYAYNVITGTGAMLGLNYSCTAFAMLGLKEGFLFFKSIYFCVHVVAIALYFLCPLLPKPRSTSPPTSAETKIKES